MIRVYGLISIPRNLKIEEVSLKNGWLLKFQGVVEDEYDKESFHQYPVTVWFKTEGEMSKFKDLLVPKSVFEISSAKLSMRKKKMDPIDKFPWAEISVYSADIRRLSRRLWEEEQKEEANGL
jgi:hypothetical protein